MDFKITGNSRPCVYVKRKFTRNPSVHYLCDEAKNNYYKINLETGQVFKRSIKRFLGLFNIKHWEKSENPGISFV